MDYTFAPDGVEGVFKVYVDSYVDFTISKGLSYIILYSQEGVYGSLLPSEACLCWAQ